MIDTDNQMCQVASENRGVSSISVDICSKASLLSLTLASNVAAVWPEATPVKR